MRWLQFLVLAPFLGVHGDWKRSMQAIGEELNSTSASPTPGNEPQESPRSLLSRSAVKGSSLSRLLHPGRAAAAFLQLGCGSGHYTKNNRKKCDECGSGYYQAPSMRACHERHAQVARARIRMNQKRLYSPASKGWGGSTSRLQSTLVYINTRRNLRPIATPQDSNDHEEKACKTCDNGCYCIGLV